MKTFVLPILIGASFVSSANALSISGDVNMVRPPVSVEDNARTNNNKSLLFIEQKDTVLQRSIDVQAFLPGVYDSSSDAVGRTLREGKTINSYFLHADVREGSNTPKVYSGSISFDTKILGVIFNDPSGNSILAAPNTSYETVVDHGLDLNDPNGDTFRISNNRMRLDFSFTTFGMTDQIRIITAGHNKDNPVPEPVTSTLMAMGLSSLGFVLRRRHTS